MENFTIYPAIDLRGGIVVRLRQGKMDQQTDYSNSPSDVAVEWMSNGAQWIHVVNLDGAFGETSSKNMLSIQSIITSIRNKVDIQLGGGIRTMQQISDALEMGISRVVLRTAVIEDPEFGEKVLEKFGGAVITVVEIDIAALRDVLHQRSRFQEIQLIPPDLGYFNAGLRKCFHLPLKQA